MTDQHPHVVVLGGGYAGTMAANRLQQNTNIDITLVNPREEFVHRLRLHQFAAGTGIATAEYAPCWESGCVWLSTAPCGSTHPPG